MIKIDTIGREWCLPCADSLEVEGVIVEREGECLGCERERVKVWSQFQKQEREGVK
jgi:hypothetical protein